MEALIATVFFALFALAVVSVIWSFQRSNEMIQNWAHQNGYHIIEAKVPLFSKGPFFWTTSKNQSVYRVVVQDGTGKTRSGWVRCGSYLGGLLSDKTEVHWDDD